MKTFWKLLGAAALVAGLTPYKVEKNAETGETSYQGLLWRITSAPGENGENLQIGINLGEGALTSKLMDVMEKKEEPHLFSDELCVEYTGVPVTEESTEEPDNAAETPKEAPETPAVAAEPETPETPAEEVKEEV